MAVAPDGADTHKVVTISTQTDTFDSGIPAVRSRCESPSVVSCPQGADTLSVS